MVCWYIFCEHFLDISGSFLDHSTGADIENMVKRCNYSYLYQSRFTQP